MPSKQTLPITEELNFHYLLGLMPPLHDVPGFAWLPELFSIIGHERLITLCKYAGGEVIQIPTIEELSQSIEALEWFYKVKISKTCIASEVPKHISPLFMKIWEIYDARDN